MPVIGLLLLFNPWAAPCSESYTARGIIEDPGGRPVSGAQVEIQTALGVPLSQAITDERGEFVIDNLPAGEHIIEVRAPKLQAYRGSWSGAATQPTQPRRIVLPLRQIYEHVTVTASPGSVRSLADAARPADIVSGEELRLRSHPTIGNSFAESVGTLVQQSTAGQVSPFLRGLTGYHVLNLIDGIRFNNSTFRYGPNQYLAFISPSQARTVEMTLGTASAEYGSDALGGVIQVLTPAADFQDRGRRVGGRISGFFGSGDLSGGSSAEVSLGTSRIALLAGGSFRRHNDQRAGAGADSHHALRRFFGLDSEQIRDLLGDRLRETAFSQHGGHLRLDARLAREQHLSIWYQHGAQEGVRGYKDMWGGMGRLRADFIPQQLDFAYLRHTKWNLGPLDSLVTTFSLNAQKDGSAYQGLKYTDPMSMDRTSVTALGYSVQAQVYRNPQQSYLFGGEFYDESVTSLRLTFPPGSRYRTLASYGQGSFATRGQRLGLQLGVRATGVWFRERRFSDVTYNVGARIRFAAALNLHARVARAFRAPNINDLGTIGLQDLGFEVPAEAVAPLGGLIGAHSGESAPSSGIRISNLDSERMFSYELGLAWQNDRSYMRAQLFDSELYDAISRRSVLFSADSIPTAIAGIPVQPRPQSPVQILQGVASVATPYDPRAVKAFVNIGRLRYSGFEAEFRRTLTPSLFARAAYFFLHGRELDPDAYVRRLPPQRGAISLLFAPTSRLWFDATLESAGRQRRLSGGDVSDERIGASRSRDDIAGFFHGARIEPYLRGGVFLPTGETLLQIQERVLPRAVAPTDTARVALYTATPGFAALHLRAGFRLGESATLNLGLANVTDRNYRHHGSGIDAPGRSVLLAWEWRF
ncbi:MAG: TonB-dependent receptor [Acidobacteria bacterium]|nr:TonB-dependent receptor [Acidobacteriota bacterium]